MVTTDDLGVLGAKGTLKRQTAIKLLVTKGIAASLLVTRTLVGSSWHYY